ncbi:zinc-ribbon domain-containing protein [Parvibaculum sp.]|uniref:zinc-ribbon domain-containing protein n=1 Tax=Parvibaculum sp. TaxID=2024848 RepID=UPI003BAA71F7
MIIHCPSCSARYPVDGASFAPSGRKVRCAKCGHSWHQSPPSETAEDMPPPPRPEEELATATVTPIRKKVFGEKSQQTGAAAAPAPSPAEDDDIVFADEALPKGEAAKKDAPAADGAAAKTGIAADIGHRFRAEVRRAASMRRGRILGTAGWLLLCLFVGGTLAGGWIYREQVAAFWPATTKLYAVAGEEINLRGLEFRNVTYERQTEDGLPVLAVMGEVANVAGENVALPRLRVGLLDEGQKELYYWTFALSERALTADEAASFITRLSSPPPEARDIEIRFVEKTDIASAGPSEDLPEAVPDAVPAPEDIPADVPDAPPAAE